MKRISNLFFYLSACLVLLNAFYLAAHGEKYFWQDTFIYFVTIVALMVYVVNMVERYSAMTAVSETSQRIKFELIIPLGRRYATWRRMTFSTSIIFGILCGGFMLYATRETRICGAIVLFSGIEKMVYLVYSKRKNYYRLGISKNAIIINNGGLNIVGLNGLKSVETKYDELLFRYKDNSVKSIFYPVSESDQQQLFEAKLLESGVEKGFTVIL